MIAGRVVERRIQQKGFRPVTQRFEWNGSDQMVAVHIERPGSDIESWKYGYDPFGRRISKELVSSGEAGRVEATKEKPLAKVAYLWDGNALVAEQKRFADGTTADVVWHYDGRTEFTPMVREESGHVSYTISDHLGTIKEVIDEKGRAIWAQSHQLWGQPLKQLGGGRAANDDFQPFKFPGQQVDAETGLYYNRFRFYDSLGGNYATSDPIALEGGFRNSVYVTNPSYFTDILGLSACIKSKIPNCPPGQRLYVNGRAAKNSGLRNTTHTETGVPFDDRGIAILDNYSQYAVTVPVSSGRQEIRDAARIAKQEGFTGNNGRWHHDPYVPGKMMYVPEDIHDRVGHIGGNQTWRGTTTYSCGK